MTLGSTSELILAMIRAGRPSSAWTPLAVDQGDEAVGQVLGGDGQPLPVVALRVAGEQVEQALASSPNSGRQVKKLRSV